MTSRLFFFGRTPELSLLELKTWFSDIHELIPGIVTSTETPTLDGRPYTDESFISLSGGIVRIATVVEVVKEVDATVLIRCLGTQQGTQRRSFAISGYGVAAAAITKLSTDMKALFAASNISARFVLPREGSVVSSVAIVKEHLEELVIIKKDAEYVIGKTTALQPFESWSVRDYDRPYADAKSGMLPPKIARMIANMALGADSRGKTLLDPFCGMGTILGEAMMRGVNVIGSDIDEDTTLRAKKNCSWLIQTNDLKTNARFLTMDATHIDEVIDADSIDAIATEPFLGSPKIGEGKITDTAEIQGIVKGLEKLYIGSLRAWTTVLKHGALVMIAFPSFFIAGKHYTVKKVVDTCENLGYTKLLGPASYSRPKAIVQRNFYLFKHI